MTRTRALLPLLALAAAAPAAAQRLPDDPRLQDAFIAWDEGRYDVALVEYLRVLAGPDGGAHVEEIALLTGEPYQVDEITPAGRANLRLGPGFRWATFDAEEGSTTPLTRIADLTTGRIVASLPAGLAATGAAITRAGELAYVTAGEGNTRALRLRNLATGAERTLSLPGWIPGGSANNLTGVIVAAPDADVLYVLAARGAAAATDVVRFAGGQITVLPTGAGRKGGLIVPAGGRHLVFTSAPDAPAAPGGRGGGGGGGGDAGRGGGGGPPADLVVLHLADGAMTRYAGRTAPALSADGSTLAFIGRSGDDYQVEVVRLGAGAPPQPTVVTRSATPLGAPALSPSGATVAFEGMPLHDWEIYSAPAAENATVLQITHEIQHDRAPRFVNESTVLALKGENRHRRSYLYDVGTREQTKLFHNNTVRTIAPEYEWQITSDGSKVVIVADRDGDTISRERGVYVVHLDRRVTMDGLRQRLEGELAKERDLRERGERAFAPIADRVRPVTEGIDVTRLYAYAKTLYEMGSKYITQPGNALAIEYYERTLRGWGYEVELQWFDTPAGGGTVRTANIVARLPGTTNPELVYVLSSHFDSVERGPGADDNSSGSTALLEVARVMKSHPQAATIEFAWFTGEEAGLRGSREYVRRAVAEGKKIVGALNNDMIGWTRNYRLDNTIRYSNGGIRDIQHAAAMLFSDLITYDARYYQSTDAQAYYDAYGDIVGGIGSYPVLESPHYHQPTDRLENVNQPLVAAVAKTTAATLMLLASSPSRLVGLEVRTAGSGNVEVSWTPAPERGVSRYRVSFTNASGQTAQREVQASGERPSLRLQGVAPGSRVSVKAVGAQGLESWDWAHAEVPR
jgi:hypothetical protein